MSRHPSPAELDAVCTALLDARIRLLRMPTARIVAAIDRAARRLLDPTDRDRLAVLRSLTDKSGFSAPMAATLLDRIAQDWLAPSLEYLISEELGGPEAIESFRSTASGRRVRAVAPALGLHVLSGNVPGVGVTSIIRALLVRSAVLAKPAAAEPALAATFAGLLVREDPEVGACVAVRYWPGGEESLESAVLGRVGLVVHYGSAAAIASLRARAPVHVRFVKHGPRISFAVIDAAGAQGDANVPHRLARAVALFDQQGCVSPQLAYVIGSRLDAHTLASATAAALGLLQAELPRGRISPAEAAAIRELRTRAEFGALAGRGGELWGPPELHYTVILSDDPGFEGSCLNRTLLIKYVPDLATLQGILEPFGHLFQTVGFAGFAGERLTSAAATLADIGATRITSLETMPWPPPAWHHDGRGPLSELIRWVDLEHGSRSGRPGTTSAPADPEVGSRSAPHSATVSDQARSDS